jgi:hypothetical protein
MESDGEIEGNDEPFAVEMPTKRLKDIMEIIDNRDPTVVNLDACLKSQDSEILSYILNRLPPSVRTVSLRFNNIGASGCEVILEWLQTNETVLVLYLMGTGIDNKGREAIQTAWGKKLKGHRTENLGYTLIRVDPKVTPLTPLT